MADHILQCVIWYQDPEVSLHTHTHTECVLWYQDPEVSLHTHTHTECVMWYQDPEVSLHTHTHKCTDWHLHLLAHHYLRYVALSHTHTHTHALSLSLTQTQTYRASVDTFDTCGSHSLPHSQVTHARTHTHTHTHTHTLSLSLSHTDIQSIS